jgi:S-adenosylmethionine:tRNA ribosyltransferase-isomerase
VSFRSACEVLLLRPVGELARPGSGQENRVLGNLWEALVRPGSKLKPGREVIVSDDLSVRIEGGIPGGGRTVRLETDLEVEEALERYGRVPLPPYLDREDEPSDRERYQTVYARDPGSVAAPTAGLHFTETLLESLRERGVRLVPISLHVGPGTFRPVDSRTVSDHHMESESWSISPDAARAMNDARANGGRLWAVGTTVVRTLETAVNSDGVIRAGHGRTDLFVTPGFRFRVVEGLITNFHLPRSTLLMLVAAFAGYDATMQAYRHAVRGDYRFYSYGDAMAIPPVRP